MSRMKYSAMSDGVLDAAIKKLKLKPPTQKTIPAKASILKAHFAEKTTAEDLSECSNCKGDSDINLDACPYCGDSEKTGDAGAIITTAEVATEAIDQVDSAELDDAVASFKKKKRNAEASIWELGVEVARIHDGDLWKTRILGGEPQYKTFKAFCGIELGISHTHAYNLIEVAKKFTREQVEEIGVAKLSIIVQLPPDQQAAALNGAAGTGKRALQQQADAAKGKPGRVPDTLTIMARADSIAKLVMQGTNSKGKPAKDLADDPWVEEEHENGVISRYQVKMDPKTKNIMLLISRRRA